MATLATAVSQGYLPRCLSKRVRFRLSAITSICFHDQPQPTDLDTSSRFCRREQVRYGVLRRLLDLPQVIFTTETLGIDFVDVLRAGRPRGKPAVLGNHLDSTERSAVARSGRKLRAYWLASQFLHADLIGRYCLQPRLLFRCRGRIDPLVERHAQLARQAVECFARVPAGSRGDFGRKQPRNQPVLVGGPDRSRPA